MKYGFFLLKYEETCHEPPAQFILWNIQYTGSNLCLAFSKLWSHLQNMAFITQVPQFFKQQLGLPDGRYFTSLVSIFLQIWQWPIRGRYI